MAEKTLPFTTSAPEQEEPRRRILFEPFDWFAQTRVPKSDVPRGLATQTIDVTNGVATLLAVLERDGLDAESQDAIKATLCLRSSVRWSPGI